MSQNDRETKNQPGTHTARKVTKEFIFPSFVLFLFYFVCFVSCFIQLARFVAGLTKRTFCFFFFLLWVLVVDSLCFHSSAGLVYIVFRSGFVVLNVSYVPSLFFFQLLLLFIFVSSLIFHTTLRRLVDKIFVWLGITTKCIFGMWRIVCVAFSIL